MLRALVVSCLLLAGMGSAKAQSQDSVFLNARDFYSIKTDSGTFNMFVGDAFFYQGTDSLYCDTLYRRDNMIEAFGNVRMAQAGGTEGTSNYLRYNSDKKLAFMRGNVNLTDKSNNLWCEELTYDLGTKTGVYNKGGTLQTDSTTVSSNSGVYHVRSKDSRFTGNVIVTDPRYTIRSEDLGYNTDTKLSTFYSRSTVQSDSGRSVLTTTGGTYDGKNVIAHFTGHSSIWNDGQYIEADSMSYNKLTGYGMAHGNVISTDTAQKSSLYCGHAEYYRKERVLWATIKPVLAQASGKDTLYMRADTFYSAPMERLMVKRPKVKETKVADTLASDSLRTVLNAQTKVTSDTATVYDTTWIVPASKYRKPGRESDSLNRRDNQRLSRLPEVNGEVKVVKKEKPKKEKRIKGGVKASADTAGADTTAPMFFIGYHKVLIYSDSLQAKCDSVCYTRSDSLIRMIYDPIAWSRKSQITGDTILMKMDSGEIRHLYVPNNAFVVSQSGPDKAKLFDQVQGKTLTAYFVKNEITNMLVFPNAESIYYSKDESNAYIGVVEAKSERMRVYFNSQQIDKIKFEKDPETKTSPMEQADLPNMKLSRYRWLIDQRPKDKETLFK